MEIGDVDYGGFLRIAMITQSHQIQSLFFEVIEHSKEPIPMLKYLIRDRSANANLLDIWNNSALCLALERRRYDVARYLIFECGADPFAAYYPEGKTVTGSVIDLINGNSMSGAEFEDYALLRYLLAVGVRPKLPQFLGSFAESRDALSRYRFMRSNAQASTLAFLHAAKRRGNLNRDVATLVGKAIYDTRHRNEWLDGWDRPTRVLFRGDIAVIGGWCWNLLQWVLLGYAVSVIQRWFV